MERPSFLGSALEHEASVESTQVRSFIADLLPQALVRIEGTILLAEVDRGGAKRVGEEIWGAYIEMMAQDALFSSVHYEPGFISADLVKPESGITSLRVRKVASTPQATLPTAYTGQPVRIHQ
ncbi:MAG: hypothetical protein WCO52_05810 [bacterium]